MTRQTVTPCVALILIGASLVSSHLCAAEFFGLGDLPGGKFKSSPSAISADGTVVVGGSDSGVTTAFRWTREEGMTSLGFLVPEGGLSNASGVSGDGSVIVGAAWSGAPPEREGAILPTRAFVWTEEDGMTGSPREPVVTAARNISNDGSVIVGLIGLGLSGIGREAVVWSEDSGLTRLGQLEGEVSATLGLGVSADGTTALLVSDHRGRAGAIRNAFLWREDEGLEMLPNAGGEVVGIQARALSADGTTVVGRISRVIDDRMAVAPFRWTADTGIVELELLPKSLFSNTAYGVSADGSIVLGQNWVEDGVGPIEYDENGNRVYQPNGPVATIWDEAHGVRSVQNLLTNTFGLGRELEGWTLERAFDISDDGTTIVGSGTNPQGYQEAWLAVVPVPEPSTIISTLIGIAMLLGARTMQTRRTQASRVK